jgi:hypothetical protein
MKQIELYKRVARALLRRFYKDLKTTEHRVAKTRHEGNPKPTPVRKNTLKQPHASPYENNYIASEVGNTKQFPSNEKTNTKEVIAANFP